MKLTAEQIQLMEDIWDGADILSRQEAAMLRDLEKEGLITTCKPMGEYGVDERRPYFGAILTKKGRDRIKEN